MTFGRMQGASVMFCAMVCGCARSGGKTDTEEPAAPAERPDAGTCEGDECEPDSSTPLSCGWTPYDDGLSGAPVTQVLFDTRTQGRVYATTGSRVYASADSGDRWDLLGELENSSFSSMALDGDDPNTLLATTSSGLVRSSDGGETWARVALEGLSLGPVTNVPTRPLRTYTVGIGTGVLRSDDGGSKWSGPGSGFPYAAATALSIDPTKPEVLVASLTVLNAQGGSASGAIARSSDGGLTWASVLTAKEFVATLRRCEADPAKLYATVDGTVARSFDGGGTWHPSPVDGGLFLWDIAVDPRDCENFYVMQHAAGLRHTIDGGKSYSPILTSALNVTPQGTEGNLAIDPRDSQHLVLATHGGVYVSHDAGGMWSLAAGLRAMAVTALSSAATDPERVWLSSWGSGVWTRAKASEPWMRIAFSGPSISPPSDFFQLVVSDAYEPGRTFVGAGALQVSTGGQSLSSLAVTGNPATVAFDQQDQNVIYVGTQVNGISKTTDGGATWQLSNGALTPWPTSAGTFIDVRSLLVDPRSPGVLYAGTNGRGLYKSSDAGATWNSVLGSLQPISCLILVEGAETTLYACADGVQASTDDGQTWFDVSEGLPSLGVGSLVADEKTGNLYASSNHGVFVKQPDHAWQGLDTECLPNAGALTVRHEGDTNFLVVAAKGTIYARPLELIELF